MYFSLNVRSLPSLTQCLLHVKLCFTEKTYTRQHYSVRATFKLENYVSNFALDRSAKVANFFLWFRRRSCCPVDVWCMLLCRWSGLEEFNLKLCACVCARVCGQIKLIMFTRGNPLLSDHNIALRLKPNRIERVVVRRPHLWKST